MIGALSWELRRLRGPSGAAAPDPAGRDCRSPGAAADSGAALLGPSEAQRSARARLGMGQATRPPAGTAAGVLAPGAASVGPGEPQARDPGSEPALRGFGSGSGPGRQPSHACGARAEGLRPDRTGLTAAGDSPPQHPVGPDQAPLTWADRADRLSGRSPGIPRDPGVAKGADRGGHGSPSHLDRPGPVIRLAPDATPCPDTDDSGELVPPCGSVDRQRQQSGGAVPTGAHRWRLKTLPVCASSETELDRWLQRLVPAPHDPLSGPVAVLARRQRFGRGQQGRAWSSPAGGVWLSAALPWPADPAAAAAPGLAVAVGLALQLEALGLAVRLKWPNDLLIAGPGGQAAKLAGLLPRLRLHGACIRWARIGIGLNGSNPVPPGATNLRGALSTGQLRPERLAARVLLALEWAMAAADQPTWVRRQAEARLLVAPHSWQGAGEGWQPHGLSDDGALVLARGEERQLLHRRFE